MNPHMKWYIDGIKESGDCLLDNLQHHSNPLTQLRLFNFFCIFNLIRYMTLLEAFTVMKLLDQFYLILVEKAQVLVVLLVHLKCLIHRCTSLLIDFMHGVMLSG